MLQVNADLGRNLTVIAAIGIYSLLHFKLVDGAVNGEIFRDFLNELVPLLPLNVIIVMDNARIHDGSFVRQWMMDNTTIRVEYLPPYSPELNLIE